MAAVRTNPAGVVMAVAGAENARISSTVQSGQIHRTKQSQGSLQTDVKLSFLLRSRTTNRLAVDL